MKHVAILSSRLLLEAGDNAGTKICVAQGAISFVSNRTNLAAGRYGFVVIKLIRCVATNTVSLLPHRTHKCVAGSERRALLAGGDQNGVHFFHVIADALRMSAAQVQVAAVVNVSCLFRIVVNTSGLGLFLVVKWRHHHGGKMGHKLGLRGSPFGANDDTLLVDLLHAVGRCAGQSKWIGTIYIHVDVHVNLN